MQFITRHRCWFDRMNTECFFNRCSGCVFSQLSIRPHLYTVIVLDLTFFFMFWLLNLVFCNIRSWVLLSLEEFFFGWEEWLRLVGWGGIRSLTPTSCRALESSLFLPPPRYTMGRPLGASPFALCVVRETSTACLFIPSLRSALLKARLGTQRPRFFHLSLQ